MQDATKQEGAGATPVSAGEVKVREAVPGDYEDTGRLAQRAYAEYARPGDPLWSDYFSMLADVAGRAAVATVLVAVVGERIVGTATVELDRTIGGSQDLDPGSSTCMASRMAPEQFGVGHQRRDHAFSPPPMPKPQLTPCTKSWSGTRMWPARYVPGWPRCGRGVERF